MHGQRQSADIDPAAGPDQRRRPPTRHAFSQPDTQPDGQPRPDLHPWSDSGPNHPDAIGRAITIPCAHTESYVPPAPATDAHDQANNAADPHADTDPHAQANAATDPTTIA